MVNNFSIISTFKLLKYDTKHNSIDLITKLLYNIVPLKLQRLFRDNGGVKLLINSSTYVIGGVLCCIYPSILKDYFYLYKNISFHHYDIMNNCKYIEEIDLNQINNINNNNNVNKSILIFIHGGAWGSGEPWMFRLCAKRSAESISANKLYIVKYPVFPNADIDEQAQSVYQSIEYISKLNNNSKNIYLIGHSSGANISALAVHKLANEKKSLVNCFIGLCGVYDISDHYQWESERGLHEISPMGKAAIHINHFDYYSPTKLLSQCNDQDIISFYPKVFLLHGIRDTTVPITSSIKYARELEDKGIQVHGVFPNQEHMDPILELTIRNESLTSSILRSYLNVGDNIL